jgi:hypothetical protein
MAAAPAPRRPATPQVFLSAAPVAWVGVAVVTVPFLEAVGLTTAEEVVGAEVVGAADVLDTTLEGVVVVKVTVVATGLDETDVVATEVVATETGALRETPKVAQRDCAYERTAVKKN